MTREEFILILKEKGYSYEMEGDKLVVTHNGNVDLESLETLPPGVEFKNGGNVSLDKLETLPPGVEFNNRGDLWLSSLKTLPPGVEFRNEWSVELKELIGGWLHYWEGNIEGVDNKRLLNIMIKQGVFI